MIKSAAKQLKLLVIDDDKWLTDLIERVVSDLDISILSINDCKLIGSTCNEFDPDIMFLDLGLQDYQGADILHYISSLNFRAKIYLVSGLKRNELEACQAVGVELDLNIVGALTKPFTREDIYYALGVSE